MHRCLLVFDDDAAHCHIDGLDVHTAGSTERRSAACPRLTAEAVRASAEAGHAPLADPPDVQMRRRSGDIRPENVITFRVMDTVCKIGLPDAPRLPRCLAASSTWRASRPKKDHRERTQGKLTVYLTDRPTPWPRPVHRRPGSCSRNSAGSGPVLGHRRRCRSGHRRRRGNHDQRRNAVLHLDTR